MSIYIKDMEMPTSCKDCPFSDHQAWCLIPGDWHKRYYCPDNEVSADCPLIFIPSHGDLIDRDKVAGFIKPYTLEDEDAGCTFGTVKRLMHSLLDRASIVIPSDIDIISKED